MNSDLLLQSSKHRQAVSNWLQSEVAPLNQLRQNMTALTDQHTLITAQRLALEQHVRERQQGLVDAQTAFTEVLTRGRTTVTEVLELQANSLKDMLATCFSEIEDKLGQIESDMADTCTEVSTAVSEHADRDAASVHASLTEDLPEALLQPQEKVESAFAKFGTAADRAHDLIEGSVGNVQDKARAIIDLIEAVKPVLQLLQKLA